jgi:hypothetical protein
MNLRRVLRGRGRTARYAPRQRLGRHASPARQRIPARRRLRTSSQDGSATPTGSDARPGTRRITTDPPGSTRPPTPAIPPGPATPHGGVLPARHPTRPASPQAAARSADGAVAELAIADQRPSVDVAACESQPTAPRGLGPRGQHDERAVSGVREQSSPELGTTPASRRLARRGAGVVGCPGSDRVPADRRAADPGPAGGRVGCGTPARRLRPVRLSWLLLGRGGEPVSSSARRASCGGTCRCGCPRSRRCPPGCRCRPRCRRRCRPPGPCRRSSPPS